MKPFRIEWKATGNAPDERLLSNVRASQGFPMASRQLREHPVAVAGGGPLLDVEALRKWPGDIWAINYTADYLLDHGIDCLLFTVDPAPMQSTAARRLLATCCDPSLFVGEVECFDLAEHANDGIAGGTTSATRAPMLAARMGYPGVCFFGCESSFTNVDHIDRNEGAEKQLVIRANGRDFRTSPQMMVQAQELSWLIAHSKNIEPRCGGLLEAMLADENWEVVGVNSALRQHILEVNGEDLFSVPFVPLETA